MRVISVKEFQALAGRSTKAITPGSSVGDEQRLQRLRAAAKLSRAAADVTGKVADTECCKPGTYSAREAEAAVSRTIFWLAAVCYHYGVDLETAIAKQAEQLEK